MFKRKTYAKRPTRRTVARYASKRKATAPRFKTWGDSLVVPRGVYSAGRIAYFRRPLEDAILYCSAPGVVSALTNLLGAPAWLSLANLTPDAGSGVVSQFGASITIALANLASAAEFLTLYDRFQIQRLEVSITNCNGDSNTNIGCYIPRVTIAPDYTDATVPTSQGYVDQYEEAQTFNISAQKTFNTSCVPKPSMQMYAGMTPGYASAAVQEPLWLDSGSSSGVPHYAFKMWFRNFFTGAASGGNAVRIAPVLWFACREPH